MEGGAVCRWQPPRRLCHRRSSDATGINGDPTNNDALYSGAAYVFERTGASWAQTTYIKAPLATETDAFGSSLGMSGDGNTLAVGAMFEMAGCGHSTAISPT